MFLLYNCSEYCSHVNQSYSTLDLYSIKSKEGFAYMRCLVCKSGKIKYRQIFLKYLCVAILECPHCRSEYVFQREEINTRRFNYLISIISAVSYILVMSIWENLSFNVYIMICALVIMIKGFHICIFPDRYLQLLRAGSAESKNESLSKNPYHDLLDNSILRENRAPIIILELSLFIIALIIVDYIFYYNYAFGLATCLFLMFTVYYKPFIRQ